MRTPSNATAYHRDPPRNTKEPEPSIGTPARRGNERAPSTAEDEALWLKLIAEIDLKQERLLDLRLDGDITPERFRARSTEAQGRPRCGAGSARSLPLTPVSPQRSRTQQRYPRLTLRVV